MFLSGVWDWVKDTASDVGDAFSDAGSYVMEEAGSIVDGVESQFDGYVQTGEDAIGTVYNDGKGVVVWAGDRVEQAQGLAEHTVDELGSCGKTAIEEGTGVISTPLLLLAGGLGLALVFAGRNTSLSYSR